MLYIWVGVSALLPQFGFGWQSGATVAEVGELFSAGPGAAAGVLPGDHILGLRQGDVIQGFRVMVPQPGDTISVSTQHGVRRVHAAAFALPLGIAMTRLAVMLSAVIIIAFATLLCVRRPGPMSLAFWIFGASAPPIGLFPILARIPPGAGLAIWAGAGALANLFAMMLISIALRFPSGAPDVRTRWADISTWIASGVLFIAWSVFDVLWAGGRADATLARWSIVTATLPLPLAVVILVRRFYGSKPVERAQTAWAIAAFGGSAIVNLVGQLIYLKSFGDMTTAESAIDVTVVLGNLFPLLAIYPILRYRLFDLGFVVNQATLYSILTLSAVGTLAAVNWAAQRVVSERLAVIVQPIAAIAIALGFTRIRNWMQSLIERLLFQKRFAAEIRIEEAIHALARTDDVEAIDVSLTTLVADVLSLHWAAVFRVRGQELIRVADVGCVESARNTFDRDDLFIQEFIEHGGAIRIDRARETFGVAFDGAADPDVAVAIGQADLFVGFGLYSRHRNETEIDPTELTLLRRLTSAAALAYRTAEMQTELVTLREVVAALRS